MLGLLGATGAVPAPGANPGPTTGPIPTVSTGDRRSINLREYKPATMMRSDSTVVVLGPRGSGKTVFMKWLLWCMKDKLDLPVVFCPTRDTREEYQQFIPRSQVYPVYSKARLSSIYETQRKISAQARSAGAEDHGGLRNLSIILDDCMFDKEEVRGKAIRAVMMNGRHDHVFFVNAVQYVVDFPRDLRSQVDVVVIFPLSGLFLKGAYEHMLNGAFDSYEECVATFEALREHECLVFDAKAKQKKLPYLFFCKAEKDLPPFRVGADWVWRLYYKYMVRPENTVRNLRNEIALTVAIAKGEIEDPDKHAKAAQQPVLQQGIVVRRYPALTHTATDADVPLLAGPGPAHPAAAAPSPTRDPRTPKRKIRKKTRVPLVAKGASLI